MAALLLIMGTAMADSPTEGRFSGKPTASIVGDGQLSNADNRVTLHFRDQTCTLAASGDPDLNDGMHATTRITLACGARQQVLWDIRRDLGHPPSSSSLDSQNFQLLWAGDADGDGKLDLLLDISPKPACMDQVEFDSHLAKPGQLVGRMEQAGKTDCPD